MILRLVLVFLFALACAGLTSLGFWQLQRAEVKRERYSAFNEAYLKRPLTFDEHNEFRDPSTFLWRRVVADGHFLDHHVLLDNRSNKGRTGYEVLTIFMTEAGSSILVNRGWTGVPGSRAALPSVGAPASPLRIQGYLGPEPVVGISLGDAADQVERLSPQHLRVQRIAIDKLQKAYDLPFAPAILYLDGDAPGALEVDWILPGDGSSRHTAYAVQWFAMAGVLALIGLYNLRRKSRLHD